MLFICFITAFVLLIRCLMTEYELCEKISPNDPKYETNVIL